MAGVKGRSGGPRPNSGGARPNSGPKPKPPPEVPLIPPTDMLTLLQDIALGRIPDATAIQVRAAIAAVQYTHAKVGEGGKKDQKNEAAGKVASKFGASPPPKLVAAGGKKV